MASVASQLIEEVTAHAQSDSLEDAREISTDGTYFPNNLSNTTCKDKFTPDLRTTDTHIYTQIRIPNQELHMQPHLPRFLS